ncbi:Protein of unknown function UPF0079 [gamma proteobacterium HdN1]|nr:Protein of unknown function UPF0079 [gamma proteobacterium HdN1]
MSDPFTPEKMQIRVCGEPAMEQLGRWLAVSLQAPLVAFLDGALGAGKTTLSRGILRGLGHDGSVKSPTYTVVEPYSVGDVTVYHFDLYRISDPDELELMGIRDYFTATSICLLEWPQNGMGVLPKPDIHLRIEKSDSCRRVLLECLNLRTSSMLHVLRKQIGAAQFESIQVLS